MVAKAVLVYSFALVSELASCGYTLAVSGMHLVPASLCSAAVAVLNLVGLLIIVGGKKDRWTLALCDVAGQVTGTVVLLWLVRP